MLGRRQHGAKSVPTELAVVVDDLLAGQMAVREPPARKLIPDTGDEVRKRGNVVRRDIRTSPALHRLYVVTEVPRPLFSQTTAEISGHRDRAAAVQQRPPIRVSVDDREPRARRG